MEARWQEPCCSRSSPTSSTGCLLLTVLLLVGAVLNAAMPYADSYEGLAAAALLLGVTSGAIPPLFFALLADRFGPASFGTCRGLTMPLIAAWG